MEIVIRRPAVRILSALVISLMLGWTFAADSAFGQSGAPTYELNPKLLSVPKGRWVKIHQQRVSDAVTFKRQPHGGSAFDSRRGRLVLFGSDTHGKNWLNSPLYFDLAQLEWQQQYPADPPSTYTVTADGLPVAGPQGDHPWAMHTFGAVTYDPASDVVVVASFPSHMVPGRFTSALETLWPQVKRHPTWILHLESGRWEALTSKAQHFFPNATAFDARRGVVIGYKQKGVFELSLATRRWRQVAKKGLLGWANNAVFDSKNGALIAFGDNKRRDHVAVYEPATGKHQAMPTPGPRPAGDRYVPMAFHPDIGQTVAIIDRFPDDGSRRRNAKRAETWLYDYATDAWTHLAEADLPFGVGMNFNLEFDPGHRLLLLVAVPPDQPLTAVWALKL